MARPPRSSPRLSASQLATYLVSPTPLAQVGILRQAKYPSESKSLIIQYQHAKRCIARCLCAPVQANGHVAEAVLQLQARASDPASGPLARDDALRSIDVIQTYQRIANALDLGDFRFEPAPNPQTPLLIEGVEVSSWPDAMARQTPRRGDARVGEVFIRCTLGTQGDLAEQRRTDANRALATIAHMHALETLDHLGTVYAPTSMVIDVPRETIVFGPTNSTRRVDNIREACRMIAARWPTV